MAIELTTADEATKLDVRQALNIKNLTDIFPEAKLAIQQTGTITFIGIPTDTLTAKVMTGTILDCTVLSNFAQVSLLTGQINTITNANTLSSLRNFGTQNAVNLISQDLSAAALDQFFTDLPTINDGRTVTINVRTNPGSLTCDASIATNKGYTVVTT